LRVDRDACWKCGVIALRHHHLTKRSSAGRHIQNERCLVWTGNTNSEWICAQQRSHSPRRHDNR
jgi:hypothetical protein